MNDINPIQVLLLVSLILLILWPLIYYVYWEPNILYKDREYFIVSYVDRHYISSFELIWSLLMYLTFIYGTDLIHPDTFQFNSQRFIYTFLILIVEVGIRELYVHYKHRSLPMKYMFDVKELISAIEMEPFHKIGKEYWESDHFIRIGHQFYPKNCVLMYGTQSKSKKHPKTYTIYVLSVDGKKHKSSNFYYSEHTEVMHMLYDTLIYRNQFTMSEFENFRWNYSGNHGYGNVIIINFLDYMANHKASKLLYDDTLLMNIVNMTKELDNASAHKRTKKLEQIREELQARADKDK